MISLHRLVQSQSSTSSQLWQSVENWELVNSEYAIGRSSPSDVPTVDLPFKAKIISPRTQEWIPKILLENPKVSRLQAILYRVADGFVFQNEGVNLPLLNGQPFKSHYLSHKDIISIAGIVLEYRNSLVKAYDGVSTIPSE